MSFCKPGNMNEDSISEAGDEVQDKRQINSHRTFLMVNKLLPLDLKYVPVTLDMKCHQGSDIADKQQSMSRQYTANTHDNGAMNSHSFHTHEKQKQHKKLR